jgi:hypothetical protein
MRAHEGSTECPCQASATEELGQGVWDVEFRESFFRRILTIAVAKGLHFLD